jgi:heme-degrading monooxygenase HmoA
MPDAPAAFPGWHLAQVNIARMVAPLDSPVMAGFVARLDELNALADRSPGFVWRFQDETGNATYLRPYADERIIFNLSVWESAEALKAYVYRTPHADMVRQRQQWFEHSDVAIMALWRIPAGARPTVDEAKARLEHLRSHGASAHAFGFRQVFPPVG